MNSPFDEAKYQALLEGLEATEILFSRLESTLRFDAEFFRKRFLLALKESKATKNDLLAKTTDGVIHPTEVVREYSESGIQILLAQNVRSNAFDFSNESFMPDEMAQVLSSNLLERADVVMTRSGANYGQTACYEFDKPIYACADVLIIKPRNINGCYLATFFNSWQGRALVDRGAYGAAQPHIAPTYLKTLPIPRFEKLEEAIGASVAL